jgi:hypothetical protein
VRDDDFAVWLAKTIGRGMVAVSVHVLEATLDRDAGESKTTKGVWMGTVLLTE